MFSFWFIEFWILLKRLDRIFAKNKAACCRRAFRTGAIGYLLASASLLLLSHPVNSAGQAAIGFEVNSDEQVLVDPTRPAGWNRSSVVKHSSERRPEVRIDYIIHSSLRKQVSINGEHLAEGDSWQDVRVVSIEAKRVLLAWRGKQWFSSITPDDRANRNNMVIRRLK